MVTVATQANDMQRVSTALEVWNRNQNSDSSEINDLDVPARDVRVDFEARSDEYLSTSSMARELGKESLYMSDRNYSLWKEHVLDNGRAAA